MKFHFMDDKVQDSLIAGVSTQNVKVEDEEKIKKVVQLEMDKKSAVENDMERRKRNRPIIIYRIPEKKDGKDIRSQSKLSLTSWIACSTLKWIQVTSKKCTDLGAGQDESHRPLLVAFKSHELKQEIMTNLRNLKETVDKFVGCYCTRLAS